MKGRINILNEKWGGKMKKRGTFLFVLITVLLLVFTGCSGTKVEEVDTGQINEYSDGMAENILSAINDEDYEKYSRDFDDTMKKAINEEEFKKSNIMIKEKIGEYISKSLYKAEKITEKDIEFTAAHYTTKFSNEPEEVYVKVVFSEVDGKKYVTGLWFDSPNLRKK